MTTVGQADLLADLQVDQRERAPVAPAARPSVPALAVFVTPLHWSRLRCTRPAGGSGLALHVGPVRVCVTYG